jgi:hypothetical protein
MTLDSHTKLRSTEYLITTTEAAAAETAEGVFGTANLAESLALTEGYSELGDWTYSATAEGRTGEVAVSGIDLDGEPGLIYSGPAGGAVRVTCRDLDVAEGTIAPEAADSVVAALFLNNDIVAFADEGYTAELDTEAAVEFNFDTYVGGLQVGDVLRLGLVGGGEEVSDWDVAVATRLKVV